MACTGIPICEVDIPSKILSINKTRRLVDMAFEMMKYVDGFMTNKFQKLKLKIGIHQGNVIAGVIGDHKPQFSLIGDTVNTTSRVCSTGESGQITLSEEAVKNLNICSYQYTKKVVEAKGKGTLNVFQVKKRGTKTAARFQKATDIILQKLKGAESPGCKKRRKENIVLKMIELLKNPQTSSEEFERNNNSIGSNIFEIHCFNMEKNTSSVKKNKLKERLNFSKQLDNIWDKGETPWNKGETKIKLTMDAKLDFSIDPKETKTNKEKKKNNEIHNKNKRKYTKKTILPLKTIAISNKNSVLSESINNNYEETFDIKKIFFFVLGEKTSREFLRQLILKNSYLEKIIVLGLFVYSILRIFMLLSLLDFFEEGFFLFMNIFFVGFLGITLLFINEFYKNILKFIFLKYYLMFIFFLGISSTFLELNFSKSVISYQISFINIAILHAVLTNFW